MPETIERPDGCLLNVELHGDRGDESLILLEGAGGDIPGWRRNIPHFVGAGLLVVAYDFRGNGRSTLPAGDVSMGTFVEDTVAVMDHFGIERADVYGQSFGGMVAQELALAHADRLRTLTLACTHGGGSHVVRGSSKGNVPKGKPYLAMYSETFAAAHPEHIAEDLRASRDLPPRPHEAGRRQWEAMAAFDAYDRLPQVTVPTLVLHGTADRVIDPANAKVLAERIPGAELVLLEGAGHLYHSEQPEAADAAVIGFIERHRA